MKISFLFVICLLVFSSFSQNIEDLRKKKDENLQILNTISDLLLKTNNQKSKTLNDLLIMNEQIRMRSELIKSINNEIDILTVESSLINTKLISLNQQLDILKSKYSTILISLYKNLNTKSLFIYIFSAENFNIAYKRYKY